MPKINVVIEGCDCTGKTTLADNLATLGFQKQKVSAPIDESDGFFKNVFLIEKTLNANTGIVLDRGPLGEAIYAPMMRGYKPAYMRALEARIKPHNLLVHLDATPEDVTARFDGQFITVEQIPQVLASFTKEVNDCKWPNVLRVNTSALNAEETFELVKLAIKQLEFTLQ